MLIALPFAPEVFLIKGVIRERGRERERKRERGRETEKEKEEEKENVAFGKGLTCCSWLQDQLWTDCCDSESRKQTY
jgi:DNA-binding transcriptional MocR family regulator